REELRDKNPVDIAQFTEELFFEEEEAERAALIFRMLPKDLAAEVFSELSVETQQALIGTMSDQELGGIIEELFVDDAVDMLEELPATLVQRVLRAAKPETRALINQFLRYPEDSAGSVMTAEFTGLKGEMTVAQAIGHIRAEGEDRETIYTCYVTDARRVLQGVVSVKDLLLSKDEALVRDVMGDGGVISVNTAEDQEEVARLFSKYGLLALPVVDSENRLVGVITVDDVMDIMQREATEDIELMGGMQPSEKPYLKTGVFSMARRRILWLLVLMVSGMLTGAILGKYEAAFAAMPLLVTFIPMLTDTGGNAGSQSSTLIIRGLALGEIRRRDVLRVMWKEFRISLLVGVILSAVNFVRLILTYPNVGMTALVVSLALIATVVMAKVIGCVLPIVADCLRVDPAIMAAPLITTIVDALSLVLYFTIAQQLLPL
ncbi:MAG: magnesium transporter, partial [Oscillospiraceae bacterium]|nr:magnesium transporter [Oscillospiraceae bacterium]